MASKRRISPSSPSRTSWATAWCARAPAKRAQNFLAEASSLAPGDLVTHIEHGIGRYRRPADHRRAGAPHDCLELQYDGGKLFLPVENIELLTRYGADEGTRSSTAWAARAGSSARRA
jgi:transcription-repair coupling factor (superfamily II helicase)